MVERRRAIAFQYLAGPESLASVGLRHGITRERVRQLVFLALADERARQLEGLWADMLDFVRGYR